MKQKFVIKNIVKVKNRSRAWIECILRYFSTDSDDEFNSTYSDRTYRIHKAIVYPQLQNPGHLGLDFRTNIRRNERSLSPISSKGSSGSELILKVQVSFEKRTLTFYFKLKLQIFLPKTGTVFDNNLGTYRSRWIGNFGTEAKVKIFKRLSTSSYSS